MNVRLVRALLCLTLALAAWPIRPAAAADEVFPAVTDQRLLDADRDPGWLMYLRTYASTGHAPWKQIDRTNVARLRPVFTHHETLPNGYESPPIVNGRTMIVTTPLNHVYALDAVTGKELWRYDYDVDRKELRTVCCDAVNRGVALYGTNAYMATLDGHVIALDARTGKLVWDHTVFAETGVGYAMSSAPMIVHGTLVIGAGGGEYGGRGFIVGLDTATGAEKWRRYTIPAPDEPGGDTWPGSTYQHGGGDPWLTGSYDPVTDTLLWGVGNPSPWLWSERVGRNLYSDSTLALDPANGHIKWYFQQTPNDPWDYDASNTPAQADVTIGGRMRHVFYQAARNGWFYVVDRTNGDFILAKPFTYATSVTGYDAKRRIGTVDAAKKPRLGQTVFTCPAFFGGDNWWPASYDPETHYAFVPGMRTCMKLSAPAKAKIQPFKAGATYVNESFEVTNVPGETTFGNLQAIDITTGKAVWQHRTRLPWTDGTLSTGGGLVFSGTPDQHFFAFDARTGKVLWQWKTASGIIGVPVSYMVDGKQYVAVQTGYGGVAPVYGGKNMAPLFKGIPLGGTLYVFALDGGRT